MRSISTCDAVHATNASHISAIASDYLTRTNLTGLASESYVDTAIADMDDSAYLTHSDLTGYATENWVSGQGYGAASDIADISADHLTAQQWWFARGPAAGPPATTARAAAIVDTGATVPSKRGFLMGGTSRELHPVTVTLIKASGCGFLCSQSSVQPSSGAAGAPGRGAFLLWPPIC